MPGLGTSFGRGGATTFAMDMKHADSIMIMGSNMAECHPVAFRWVMQAKTRPENPCTIIHVDPRFTRTSAMADIYAPLRAGSDIVFLGALIRYVLQAHEPIFHKEPGQRTPREQFFHDYLVHYTNAATLISEDFKDTDDNDLAGLFSGFDANQRKYDKKKWRYETESPAGKKEAGGKSPDSQKENFSDIVKKLVGPRPKEDPTLRNPRCVFQILLKHYARYTPALVEEVCGTPKETFLKVAKTLLDNAGPERTGCTECGSCMTGCRVGAKNTLVKNYLYLAEQDGAKVIPLTTVTAVKPIDGGYEVSLKKTGTTSRRFRTTITDRKSVV